MIRLLSWCGFDIKKMVGFILFGLKSLNPGQYIPKESFIYKLEDSLKYSEHPDFTSFLATLMSESYVFECPCVEVGKQAYASNSLDCKQADSTSCVLR